MPYFSEKVTAMLVMSTGARLLMVKFLIICHLRIFLKLELVILGIFLCIAIEKPRFNHVKKGVFNVH